MFTVLSLAAFLTSCAQVPAQSPSVVSVPTAKPAVSAPATVATKWEKLKPDGAGFEALMPSGYTVEKSTEPSALGPILTIQYSSAFVDHAPSYLVGDTTGPAGVITPQNHEELLKGMGDSIAASTGGKVIHEEKITINGSPGRELIITDGNSPLLIRARITVANGHMYMIGVTDTEGSVLFNAESGRFLDSLKLIATITKAP